MAKGLEPSKLLVPCCNSSIEKTGSLSQLTGSVVLGDGCIDLPYGWFGQFTAAMKTPICPPHSVKALCDLLLKGLTPPMKVQGGGLTRPGRLSVMNIGQSDTTNMCRVCTEERTQIRRSDPTVKVNLIPRKVARKSPLEL